MPIYKMKGSKDGKQKYRVRVNYLDIFGKKRQSDRVVYGYPEAKDIERETIYKLKSEKTVGNITVKKLYEEYLQVIKCEVRESTYNKKIDVLKPYVIDLLGEQRLDKLNNKNLINWKTSISNIKIVSKKKKDFDLSLSLRMKQNIYSDFRAMLNFAVKMGYIAQNPLTKVGNFKGTLTFEDHKNINYYTPEEFIKFINIAKERAENSSALIEWDYYVFFCIAYYTGMRKGEIHALKWSDIDGAYINVSRSITQKQKGEDRETPPKNKSSIRTIQTPSPLKKTLDEHKERYKQLNGFNDDYRICGGTKSLRDSTVEKRNALYAKQAEVKKIRIHDFRHSHASLLANEGINIQEIARRLGHSKIEMTWNTYAHLYPREEERAIKILDEIEV